jgi:hypothetical protein
MQTAERKAVVASPDLESLTASHIERAFLTVRPGIDYQRKGLGYSKDLETQTHKLAVALHFRVYYVRRHTTLGTTLAVARGGPGKALGLGTRCGNHGGI